MILKISKEFKYEFLFVLCVGIPYLNNYELTFLIWSLTLLLSLQSRYSYSIFKQVLVFGLILLIGIISSLFYKSSTYDLIRDVTYLIKPILGLLIGYQLCRGYLKKPIDTVINAGVLLAFLHLFLIMYGYVFKGFKNIHELRGFAGFFSDYEVFATIFLLFNNQFEVVISRNRRTFYLIILIISSFAYLSRANFIQFGVFFIAMKGYFVINKKSVIVLLSVIITGIILYSAVLYYNPKRNGKGFEAFMYKVKIAPTEPFKSKINTSDYKDFNDNYRSVENINTIAHMEGKNNFAFFFGNGLGSRVDLKQEIWLDGVVLRYISILHNGFMTVYLKSGFVGVLLLLISIFFLFKRNKSEDLVVKNINYLLVGTAIFMFISYWVFMGLYFKADTKSILIGLLIAFSEKLLKEEANKKGVIKNILK